MSDEPVSDGLEDAVAGKLAALDRELEELRGSEVELRRRLDAQKLQ